MYTAADFYLVTENIKLIFVQINLVMYLILRLLNNPYF